MKDKKDKFRSAIKSTSVNLKSAITPGTFKFKSAFDKPKSSKEVIVTQSGKKKKVTVDQLAKASKKGTKISSMNKLKSKDYDKVSEGMDSADEKGYSYNSSAAKKFKLKKAKLKLKKKASKLKKD